MKARNRNAWNLGLAAVLLGAIVYAIARATTFWVIPGLVALVLLLKSWQWLVRFISLRRNGYFAGRQVRDRWVYEEVAGAEVRTLDLKMKPFEPGRYILVLPSEANWRSVVPEWARERRNEILARIGERLKAGDMFPEPTEG